MTNSVSAVSIGRTAFVTTGLTMAGYSVSLVQSITLARVLGISMDTDALAAALTWVTAVGGLLSFTAASVMVPFHGQEQRTSHDAARLMSRAGSGVWMLLGAAMSLLTFAAADVLASVLLPGSEAGTVAAAATVLRIVAVIPLLWAATAVGGSIANAHERFRLVAVSSAAQPLAVTIALLASPSPSIDVAAIGFVIGACAQLGLNLLASRGWLGDVVPSPVDARVFGILRRAAPVALGVLLLNAGLVASRALASLATAGDVTVVDYSFRLITAMLSMLTGGLTVVLVEWSRDPRAVADRLPIGRTLRFAVGILIPAAVLVGVLATEIVAVLFGGGNFGTEDVEVVAGFLRLMTPGVAANALFLLILRALLARDAGRALVLCASVQVVTLTLVSFATLGMLGVNGIAVGYSAGWVVAVSLSAYALRPALGARPGIFGESIRATATAIVAATGTIAVLVLVQAGPLLDGLVGCATFVTLGSVVGRRLGVDAIATLQVASLASLRARARR